MNSPPNNSACAPKGSSHRTAFVCGGGWKTSEHIHARPVMWLGGWKTSEHIHARPVMWLFLMLSYVAALIAFMFEDSWGIYSAIPIPVFLSIALWSRLRQKPKEMGLSVRGHHDPHSLY